MYLRQWYYDPDHENTNDTRAGDKHWFPVTTYGTDRDNADFYYATTSTRSATVSGKDNDGYYQFNDLPVRVFVKGKEYLAGYTVAIRGNLSFTPGKVEMETTPDTSVTDINRATETNPSEHDLWNSKGQSNVNAGGPREYRFGLDTFPLVRKDAFSSNGDIHTLDAMLVLAGSTTVDATGATRAPPSIARVPRARP